MSSTQNRMKRRRNATTRKKMKRDKKISVRMIENRRELMAKNQMTRKAILQKNRTTWKPALQHMISSLNCWPIQSKNYNEVSISVLKNWILKCKRMIQMKTNRIGHLHRMKRVFFFQNFEKVSLNSSHSSNYVGNRWTNSRPFSGSAWYRCATNAY